MSHSNVVVLAGAVAAVATQGSVWMLSQHRSSKKVSILNREKAGTVWPSEPISDDEDDDVKEAGQKKHHELLAAFQKRKREAMREKIEEFQLAGLLLSW